MWMWFFLLLALISHNDHNEVTFFLLLAFAAWFLGGKPRRKKQF